MRWFICVLMAVLLVGCSVAGFSVQSSQYRIQVTLDTAGIGKRTLTLTLTDLQNNPVSDATVMVTPIMPQHGMLGVPQAMRATGNGVYQLDALDLTMTGEWQLQYEIKRNGQRDTLTLPITIN